jgi:hypothetical protein
MDTTQKDTTRQDWMIFLISAVICIALVIFASEWFWVALPFVLTYLVRALKAM